MLRDCMAYFKGGIARNRNLQSATMVWLLVSGGSPQEVAHPSLLRETFLAIKMYLPIQHINA